MKCRLKQDAVFAIETTTGRSLTVKQFAAGTEFKKLVMSPFQSYALVRTDKGESIYLQRDEFNRLFDVEMPVRKDAKFYIEREEDGN